MFTNKYDGTMYEWYYKLAKAKKRLLESIAIYERFEDDEEWIIEDATKVLEIKKDIEDVKRDLLASGYDVDFDKIKASVKLR